MDVPNFPPYAWFDNDRLTSLPTEEKPEHLYGNPGPACPDWELEAMIPTFTDRAVAFIEEQAEQSDPFFLYFPLTSPHSPVVPNKPFVDRSGIGNYGDFVCEIDDLVGQLIDALDRTVQRENTLIVFTSDNGPENQVGDDEGAYNRAERTDHFSMGSWRGIKRDAWEGGHRLPFIVSWPAAVTAGTTCDHLACLGDLFATCADILSIGLPD
ncbi:MAG: sulfatase-like hydrolase/transferase [Opitutales bacterium]